MGSTEYQVLVTFTKGAGSHRVRFSDIGPEAEVRIVTPGTSSFSLSYSIG
jgi:hypothetical protein